MKLGASDLLTKPFDLDALLAALEAAFDRKGSEGLETIRDHGSASGQCYGED